VSLNASTKALIPDLLLRPPLLLIERDAMRTEQTRSHMDSMDDLILYTGIDNSSAFLNYNVLVDFRK
jgi:hypothetical protein